MKVPEPRRLKSGRWFVQLRLGGQSIPISAPDKASCRKLATVTKAEYLAGKYEPQERRKALTLTQAIDNYIAARSNILSPSTIRGYRMIQRHRFPSLMERDVYMLTEQDYAAAVNAEAATVSAKTLKNSWLFVASVLRDQTGSAPSVSLPQVIPNERPFLDAEQIRVFLAAIEGDALEVPILLALHSLRRSEIAGLRWEAVDLQKNLLHVQAAAVMDEHDNLVLKPETKNASSNRVIPIMIPRLAELLAAAQKPTGPVVACHPNTIYKHVNSICSAHGLPRVGAHGLRHSFASLAYSLRLPEKVTMQLGGWSDNQTMRKIYTHVAQSDLEKSVAAVSSFFADAENANKMLTPA